MLRKMIEEFLSGDQLPQLLAFLIYMVTRDLLVGEDA